jgi:hypothetical protein
MAPTPAERRYSASVWSATLLGFAIAVIGCGTAFTGVSDALM